MDFGDADQLLLSFCSISMVYSLLKCNEAKDRSYILTLEILREMLSPWYKISFPLALCARTLTIPVF